MIYPYETKLSVITPSPTGKNNSQPNSKPIGNIAIEPKPKKNAEKYKKISFSV